MSILNRLRLGQNNRGDTIVEVMIVLAVLGLALSISYATASRSLLNARQAQESSEATVLAQTQVEDLRILAGNNATTGDGVHYDIYNQTIPFCVPGSPTAVNPITLYSGSQCNFGVNNPYTVLVYNCSTLASDPNQLCTGLVGSDTLVVQASWPDVLGNGIDHATLTYRVHQVAP